MFAKLLAALTRKTGTGGEETGEIATEGLGGTEKNVRAAKNAAGKRAESPGEKLPLQGGEKIQNRDRRFLAELQEGGEVSSPEAKLQGGPGRKTKAAAKGLEGEEAALLSAAGALTGDEPLPEGLDHGETPGLSAESLTQTSKTQDSLIRLAEIEGQSPEGLRVSREQGEEGTEPGANAEMARQAPGMVREKPGAEKKETAAAAEPKNARKNRERFALEVRDPRTGGAANAGQETQNRLELRVEPTADLTVDLRNHGKNQELPQPGREKTASQAFEDILARELHQNLNGDIVRQASIMVKDGGEGTIRLSLKPESLGMVKVRLEMAENKITGHIIVESNEALRAFER
ncbi:MAG: flagellar hook-length control protein FliK, partial [Treponema sp.]|nr:flagellar hook-length control protein FliK [Treponema sp.]